MKVSVIIPVYNEAGNIGPLVRRVRDVLKPGDELIVVDDGSSDGTPGEVDTSLCTLVKHEVNRGKGAAMRTGIAAAGGEIVVFIGGDGQDDPKEISVLLKGIEDGADYAIGSRFVGGAKRYSGEAIQTVNEFGNKTLTMFINLFFGVSATDSQAEFKCIKADLLKNLGLTSDRFEIETEMLARASRRGAKIVEVPVHRYARGHGVSKLYGIPLGRLRFAIRTLGAMAVGYFKWR
jgi:glycosyltransferase involved in cell wall biosynthesis